MDKWCMGLVELQESERSSEDILLLFESARNGSVYSDPKSLFAMLKIFSKHAKIIEG